MNKIEHEFQFPAYGATTEGRIRHHFAFSATDDVIEISDSFVVEESLIEVATKIKELLPGARLVGTSNITILVWADHAIVECSKYGGRCSDAFRGITDITICATPSIAIDLISMVGHRYEQYRQAKLKLWYMSKDGPTPAEILLNTHGNYAPEFYPWLESDYFDRYLASDASILFMAGPPGTGKTSVLRHVITSRALHASATYDEKVLASDAMFLDFITSSSRGNILVIEDADNILTMRSHGENALISRFLNFSDGLAKFPDKKIVFTTNLTDFGNVDPALTRLGRCFGALYARALTPTEALRASQIAGIQLPTVTQEITIAEIFNYHNQRHSIEPITMGFHPKIIK